MKTTSFRGYEILEVLPAGGMSTVYKARQLSLDRIVAIKVLPPTMGVAPADVEKFMAEARITAGLKHPNIVQVYDFGKSEDGVCYFVMEYISGYSVAAWIHRKQYLSEENALLCGFSVAMAMNYAWQKAGIVHCDIKPDNVIIDDDGTVKLADLGLARSVQSIWGQVKSDDRLIFGTPNYISPEQSRGNEPLDCRADIYSLGAMLYHCLTGTMPFEGVPSLEVMDRQITDFIPDLQDVNPRISVWSACLIEKMMAKDRNFRQKDWNELLRDISNARSEMMPQGYLPLNVVSTIKRSAMRDLRLQEVYHSPISEPAKTRLFSRYANELGAIKTRLPVNLWQKTMLTAAGAVLILIAGWSAYHLGKKYKIIAGLDSVHTQEVKKVQQPAVARQGSISEVRNIQADADRRALEKYEEVVSWAKTNPANPDESILRFRKLADKIAGTKYADMARNEAQKLALAKGEIAKTIAELDEKANLPAGRKHFLEAAAVYDKYQGPFEKETASERGRKAQLFMTKHAGHLKEQERVQKLAKLQLMHVADEIAMVLVEDDLNAALWRMRDLPADLPLISAKPEFKNLTATLEKSIGAERIIIDSFRSQKDQEINISFLYGPQKLLIRDVQGDLVIAEKIVAIEEGTISSQKVFKVRDLTLAEKVSRIGNGKKPEFALMHSMLAVQDGDYQEAAAAAARTGPFLSETLPEAIGRRAKDVGEGQAAQAFACILNRAGIHYKDNMPDPEYCLNILRDKERVFRRGAGMNRMIGLFRARFGSTEIAKSYDGVLDVLTNVNISTRDDVAQALSPFKPEERPQSVPPITKSVAMKMMEQNPGLPEDQIAFQTNDSGRIVRAEIVSMHLRDIQALENLTNLQKLVCAGMRQNVWPVMPAIAPLSDLKPLRKMLLYELTANHTRIKDISVLSQMPLTGLNLAHTKVNDLQPLKGMPLQYLDVSFTPVRDIRPLAGLPLAYLNISGTEVSNLSPLFGMPLKTFSAVFTRIRDLTPLHSMPLNNLSLRNTEVTDLAPLNEMPLEYLDLADTNVRDILPLWGMRLRKLDLRNTKVKNLSALEQMPLEELKINGSAVKDISPLRNMPLKVLDLRSTNVADLTPIKDSLIEEIWLDDLYNQANNEKTRAILAVLQRMPKLKSINGKSLLDWTAKNEQ